MRKKKIFITPKAVEDFYQTDKANINFWLARMQRYDKEKVLAVCQRAGASDQTAASIAAQIDRYVDSRMKMSDIRPLIFALLQRKDPAAAKRFRAGEIFVQTSRQTYEPFNRNKIAESIMRETGLEKQAAHRIAREVESLIRATNPDFLSASLIRELANAKLLEHGYEPERRLYTRLGMPVFDVTQLINIGLKENANLQYNPETLHKLIADEVLKEYALLRVIPKSAADAHIRGLLHIHDLDYFVLRPFCFSHDLRFFLRNGYCADGQGIHTAAAGPARHGPVAILHAAKILASSQVNCGGGQGYNWFNTYMAPFLRGKSYKDAKQLAQMFLFEMSQMYIARGGQTIFSSIDIDPAVPEILRDIPAVLPGGIVKPDVVYGDFETEANMFFNALLDVYIQGDAFNKPFNWPKCEIKISPDLFEKFPDEMLKISQLAAKFGTPYYFIQQDYMPRYTCYQCCAYQMPLSNQNSDEDLLRGTVRGGALQVITINLPRLAYDAGGDDTKLFELLAERMAIARDVLLVKRDIIKKRLAQNLLPFMAQPVDEQGTPYLVVDKQVLEIGFVGLNEALKIHTGSELHESTTAWRFGLKIIKTMADIAGRFSQEVGAHFAVSRTPAEYCAHRLARIDLKELNGKAFVQGDLKTGAVYYTNGMHVRPDADIPLFERLRIEAAFHPLLTGGAMSHVWLGETYPDPEALTELTKRIVRKTLMAYYAYTKDLTICKTCKWTSPGILRACPKCSSKDIDWYSRITGYLQRVSSWNAGKQREFWERRRYRITGLHG